MGRAGKNFRSVAMELLEANVGEISEEAIATSLSNKGNFLSLTVTIRADSKQQLDNLYRDLSTHDEVLLVLWLSYVHMRVTSTNPYGVQCKNLLQQEHLQRLTKYGLRNIRRSSH